MWETILNMITSAVRSAFIWFVQILDAAPGSWDTFFTLFVIFALSRFLLGPILGTSFVIGSDTVKGHSKRREFRRFSRESYNELKNKE